MFVTVFCKGHILLIIAVRVGRTKPNYIFSVSAQQFFPINILEKLINGNGKVLFRCIMFLFLKNNTRLK